jgi:hypothetical protein
MRAYVFFATGAALSIRKYDLHHHGAIEITSPQHDKWTLHAELVITTITDTAHQQREQYESRTELMAGEVLSRV